MNVTTYTDKVLNGGAITREEALYLYEQPL